MEKNIICAKNHEIFSHLNNKDLVICFIEKFKKNNNYKYGKKNNKDGFDFYIKTEFGDQVKIYSTDFKDIEYLNSFGLPWWQLYFEIQVDMIQLVLETQNAFIDIKISDLNLKKISNG